MVIASLDKAMTAPFVCQKCVRTHFIYRPPQRVLRLGRPSFFARHTTRPYSTTDGHPADDASSKQEQTSSETKDKKPSAMSRRLEEATEEALLTGGRAGRRAIEEAGFSDELKDRLFNKIADANFRAEHTRTLTTAGLDPTTLRSENPSGSGTRGITSGQPWTGDEAPQDTVLRMLDDARKPLPRHLRGKPKIPDPIVVDLRLRRAPSTSPTQWALNARDKATAYATLDRKTSETKVEKGLSEDEREALRQEFRDRFSPGARAMPNTFSGLAALANERIEDAISRGQFQNIPRGPGVKRDTRADNPFIDTTEYIMNKMIQRQDMVPPWIEKQQELARAARVFRAQLRTSWRRHAARTISSRGGTLQGQMAQAERYARAEQVHNPRRRDVEQIPVPTSHTDDPVMTRTRASSTSSAEVATGVAAQVGKAAAVTSEADMELTPPFRDAQWETAERSYMELSVAKLNALTRSYNLMAPELAKKPYFSLDRELLACFADVAPTLAETIRDRAARPAKAGDGTPGEAMGRRVLVQFVGEGTQGAARVYDSKTPHYGLKDMWRDLWKKD